MTRVESCVLYRETYNFQLSGGLLCGIASIFVSTFVKDDPSV